MAQSSDWVTPIAGASAAILAAIIAWSAARDPYKRLKNALDLKKDIPASRRQEWDMLIDNEVDGVVNSLGRNGMVFMALGAAAIFYGLNLQSRQDWWATFTFNGIFVSLGIAFLTAVQIIPWKMYAFFGSGLMYLTNVPRRLIGRLRPRSSATRARSRRP